MTQTRTQTAPKTSQLAGAIADGTFKVLLGAAFMLGADWIGDLLGAPSWLMATSGAALLLNGGVEIRHVRSRSMHTYIRLMVAYDSGWALASLAGLLMAWQGSTAGGEVWMGYQAAAPLAFIALLLTSASVQSVRPTPRTGAEHPAPLIPAP